MRIYGREHNCGKDRDCERNKVLLVMLGVICENRIVGATKDHVGLG
jgi:hypothetical protein